MNPVRTNMRRMPPRITLLLSDTTVWLWRKLRMLAAATRGDPGRNAALMLIRPRSELLRTDALEPPDRPPPRLAAGIFHSHRSYLPSAMMVLPSTTTVGLRITISRCALLFQPEPVRVG